ncbi:MULTISPECIES: phosphoglycerate mutase family protein [unclassified Paraburkholderia]|uniref:phosphoglycerate mutase family protein n=1 Tax=unclassified Paraburkholderia TaxID=2615204 RepID=UPI002AB6E0BF|nr:MULTISPECIES: phosphoglycerate mutase family protein [unclassified Paraburkholderia]
MRPNRIMFIRHAEKPASDEGIGIEADGKPDAESLCVRGWQRAGALARFFCPNETTHATPLKPATVFAAGAGPSSKSKRSMQTVAPLVSLLRETSQVDYVNTYLKDDGRALMTDVLSRPGVVLIAWEHKVLPSLIGHIPRVPTVPATWPDERFDMVWIFDRAGEGWSFSQLPQSLLAGDSNAPIR